MRSEANVTWITYGLHGVGVAYTPFVWGMCGNRQMDQLGSEWLQQIGAWAEDHRFALINASLLLAIGWLLARWVGKRVQRIKSRPGRVSPYRIVIAGLVRYTIVALVLVTALSALGVPTAGGAVVFVAVTLAVAVAAQGTLHNVIAGALVQALRPLRVGDAIETDGAAGLVTEIGLLTISLRSDDGVFISIPNCQLWSGVVRNYSRLGTRRFEVTVSIGYDQDIDEVVSLCRELMASNGRVLRDPPPDVVVAALGDTAVAISVRGWTCSPSYADVRCQLNREIKKALDAAGIHMAPMAPRLPTQVAAEPPTYLASALRARGRSRAIEP